MIARIKQNIVVALRHIAVALRHAVVAYVCCSCFTACRHCFSVSRSNIHQMLRTFTIYRFYKILSLISRNIDPAIQCSEAIS